MSKKAPTRACFDFCFAAKNMQSRGISFISVGVGSAVKKEYLDAISRNAFVVSPSVAMHAKASILVGGHKHEACLEGSTMIYIGRGSKFYNLAYCRS
jgi:hypothetical protein